MSEESLRLGSFSPLKTLRILRIHSLEVHKGFSPVCLGPLSMEYVFTVQDADGGLGEWIHTTSVCVCVFVFDFLFCTGV